MASVQILEGAGIEYDMTPDALLGTDIDMLGWGNPFRPSTYRKASRKVKRVVNKVTRPVRNVVRPIYRPVDRILKKTPIVRTAYRGMITSAYASTGQYHKVWGATKRTGRSAVKDFGSIKRVLVGLAKKIVYPMAKSGMSKQLAKVTAIPALTAKASAMYSPAVALPVVPVAVNEAINSVWSRIRSTVKRVTVKSGSGIMSRISRNIGGRGFNSQKMSYVPSVPPRPQVRLPSSAPVQQPIKSSGAGAMLAIPAVLALTMMAG
jgi:hypothetical protein